MKRLSFIVIISLQMKRFLLNLILLCCLVLSAGCASWMHPKIQPADGLNTGLVPVYSGLKAQIAVADFDIKSTKVNNRAGAGLRQMLIDALSTSNRFSIIQRQDLSLSVPGNQSADKAQKDKPVPTGLIISVTISEFEPQSSGGRGGLGGGGSAASAMLGGLLGGMLNKAHVALEIRIIDAATSKVIASAKVQGQASDTNGGLMTGSLGSWALGPQLSVYVNTPMEKAIRICIIEAARFISQAVPAEYYKDEGRG